MWSSNKFQFVAKKSFLALLYDFYTFPQNTSLQICKQQNETKGQILLTVLRTQLIPLKTGG